jgi:hypothetical protein
VLLLVDTTSGSLGWLWSLLRHGVSSRAAGKGGTQVPLVVSGPLGGNHKEQVYVTTLVCAVRQACALAAVLGSQKQSP